MRFLVVALGLVCATACRSDSPSDSPGTESTGATSIDDYAREQARFDAERRPQEIVAALAIGPGSHVADVGAGSGLLTVHLARAVGPTGKVVATDVDGAVLDLLAARLEANKLSTIVERRVVAADVPGLEPASYDAILLAEVDNYFSDPVKWLTAATVALKPGGRIVISNRIHHRGPSLDAARKAGLVLRSESIPVPSHFIATFVAASATVPRKEPR